MEDGVRRQHLLEPVNLGSAGLRFFAHLRGWAQNDNGFDCEGRRELGFLASCGPWAERTGSGLEEARLGKRALQKRSKESCEFWG
jgi:hypothetical protein